MRRPTALQWCMAGGLLVGAAVSAWGYRTVSDKERGLMMNYVYGCKSDHTQDNLSDIGGVLKGSNSNAGNSATYLYFNLLKNTDNDSVKLSHGEYFCYSPYGETTWPYFPYAKFDNLSTWWHTNKGVPYFFYKTNGGANNVFWNWSLFTSGGGFPANGQAVVNSPTQWKRGVDITNDNFIHYWIHEYVYGIIHRNEYTMMWNSGDEVAMSYGLWGKVVPEAVNGIYTAMVSGGTPRMDTPYPQTTQNFMDNFSYELGRFQALAPDLKTAPNIGYSSNYAGLVSCFSNANGMVLEDLLLGNAESTNPDPDKFYYRMWNTRAMDNGTNDNSTSGGVAMLRSHLDPTDGNYAFALKKHYVAYLLHWGENSFWATIYHDPVYGTDNETNPADYAYMKNWLGRPCSEVVLGPQRTSIGRRYYTRCCDNRSDGSPYGFVALNLADGTETITLPAGSTWYREGVLANSQAGGTTFTLASQDATWWVRGAGTMGRAPMPLISPLRFSYSRPGNYVYRGSSTFQVTLTNTADPTMTHIMWTDNGTTPTSTVGNRSDTRTTVITVQGDKVIKVKCISDTAGYNAGSPVNENRFSTLAGSGGANNQVFFALGADNCSESILRQYWVLVGLQHPAIDNCSVEWYCDGADPGTAQFGTGAGKDWYTDNGLQYGTVTFAPGEIYKRFKIKIWDDAVDEATYDTIKLKLRNPSNCTIDTNRSTFTYTIVDDDP